jgi:hypothetical protein
MRPGTNIAGAAVHSSKSIVLLAVTSTHLPIGFADDAAPLSWSRRPKMTNHRNKSCAL